MPTRDRAQIRGRIFASQAYLRQYEGSRGLVIDSVADAGSFIFLLPLLYYANQACHASLKEPEPPHFSYSNAFYGYSCSARKSVPIA